MYSYLYSPVSIIIITIVFIIIIIHIKNNFTCEQEKNEKLSKKINSLEIQNKELCKKNSLLESQLSESQKALALSEKKLLHRNTFFKKVLMRKSKSMPYLAAIMADYLTYDIEVLAKQLDWGYSIKRDAKVKTIREIRQQAKDKIESLKHFEYQLKYLLQLYPELSEILDIDSDLKSLRSHSLTQSNNLRSPRGNKTSFEDWNKLTEAQKNQLILDNYIASSHKSKWQIGRDYELFIGYLYEKKGWDVTYFGTEMRIKDLGRDLIAIKNENIEIIQCKYWSSKKQIHEKHIFQLYGTTICYKIERPSFQNVSARFVTNITLSETAKKVADYLGVKYVENQDIGNFPRIKCNIGKDEFGNKTKIYHLPMDQQYDSVKIDSKKGEFFALTVDDAEKYGFRRAYKWGNS